MRKYHVRSFDQYGIHRDTGTKYDKDGYDIDGFDKDGYNIRGFNKYDIHRDTGNEYDKDGYDVDGYDKDGYNRRGFDAEGIYGKTGTKYDENGFDVNGLPCPKYNIRGFNPYGIHRKTGTKYDIRGFDQYGIHRDTGTEYDKDGYDRGGFDQAGIHRDTGTKYNKYGRDKDGFNEEGRDRYKRDSDGYNLAGRNSKGVDRDGFGKDGFNELGKDREGYGRDGFNDEGVNRRGFMRNKIHKDTGTPYDPENFDYLGIDSNGINMETGRVDERVIFAKDFIDSKKSVRQYAKSKEKTVEEIEEQLKIAKSITCIRDDIIKALERNADKYVATKRDEIDRLINGKKNVRDVKGIEETLRLCNSKEEKEKVMKLLIAAIVSHDIKILEYKDIFAIKIISGELPQNIIEKIDVVKMEATRSENAEIRKQAAGINKEIKRLKDYRSPHKKGEIPRIGYMENGKDIMFDVTSEQEELAKRYLKATDEFICHKTMFATLLKIGKGDVKLEDIEKLEDVRKKPTEEHHDSEDTDNPVNGVEEISKENEQNQKRRKELLGSIRASQEELSKLTLELETQEKTSLRYRRNIDGEIKNE